MKLKIYISVLLGFLLCQTAYSQNVALKTNLLGWVGVTPNLGIEVGIGGKSTFDVGYSINPFEFGEYKYWKHWKVVPEYRYWFCEKFHGHFLGIHAIGGEYNLSRVKLPFGIYKNTQEARYQGWGVGGGISYGYQWLLSKHWSFEATVGVGYIYSEYDIYPCASCGNKLDSGSKHYFGPTKAALNLIYVF